MVRVVAPAREHVGPGREGLLEEDLPEEEQKEVRSSYYCQICQIRFRTSSKSSYAELWNRSLVFDRLTADTGLEVTVGDQPLTLFVEVVHS